MNVGCWGPRLAQVSFHEAWQCIDLGDEPRCQALKTCLPLGLNKAFIDVSLCNLYAYSSILTWNLDQQKG